MQSSISSSTTEKGDLHPGAALCICIIYKALPSRPIPFWCHHFNVVAMYRDWCVTLLWGSNTGPSVCSYALNSLYNKSLRPHTLGIFATFVRVAAGVDALSEARHVLSQGVARGASASKQSTAGFPLSPLLPQGELYGVCQRLNLLPW